MLGSSGIVYIIIAQNKRPRIRLSEKKALGLNP